MREIKALIFDFDGLILDTEMPRYTAWRELYSKYNCNLSISEYASIVGSDDSSFDFYKDLENKYDGLIDWEIDTSERRKRNAFLLEQEKTLPGVKEYIFMGKRIGLKIALCSSSPKFWIETHLPKTGLLNYFDCITTIEETGKAKPDPALFNLTIKKLKIEPYEAIVFEDSPNGCKAAEGAGIFCVAVPNQITKNLKFDCPDLLIESMNTILLEEIIKKAEKDIA